MRNRIMMILCFLLPLSAIQCQEAGSKMELDTADISALIKKKPYTLIYYWTTWCGPCRKTLSETLPQITKSLDSSKVQLLVIAVSADEKAVSEIRSKSTLKSPPYRLKFFGPDIWLSHKAAIKSSLEELFPDQQIWNNSVPVFLLTNENQKVLYKKLPSSLEHLPPLLHENGLLVN